MEPETTLRLAKLEWRTATQCTLPLLSTVQLKQVVLPNPMEELGHAEQSTHSIVFDNRFYFLTTSERISFFTHELGHLLGLFHRPFPSIMFTPLDSRRYITGQDAADVRSLQRCN